VSDEVVRPNFKQHANLAGGNRFSSTNQPRPGASAEAARAKASVKEALMNAQDKLGNEAVFLEMWRGNPAYKKLPEALAARLLAEDRRCYLNIVAKLLPIEVQGALDASITVKVVSMLDYDPAMVASPRDAALLPVNPAMPEKGRDPEGDSG
jgi:hypothetical protein